LIIKEEEMKSPKSPKKDEKKTIHEKEREASLRLRQNREFSLLP